jgi:hypothetical protein
VPEISVTVLHVHESKARRTGEPRGFDEIINQAIDFLVRHHAHAVRETAIEHRMVTRRERLRPVPHLGPRVPSGMGELKSDDKIPVRIRSEAFAMRRHELLPQRRDCGLRARAHQ